MREPDQEIRTQLGRKCILAIFRGGRLFYCFHPRSPQRASDNAAASPLGPSWLYTRNLTTAGALNHYTRQCQTAREIIDAGE